MAYQTYLEVVQNSCNPGFVELGERLGKEALFKYIRDFGFGEKTGIDLQGEGKGILFNLDRVGPVEQATTAFGQGVSVTPIQQVAAISAAVNGGTLYTPYIAKELINPATGEVLMKKSPDAKRKVISKETSDEIRKALESVVAKGSGKKRSLTDIVLGEKQELRKKRKMAGTLKITISYHLLDLHLLMILSSSCMWLWIIQKEPFNLAAWFFAPIVGEIMGDSLRAMGVKPRKNQIEKELTWMDSPMIEVPDMVGLTKKDLGELYLNLKIDASGTGNTVVKQTPQPGIKLKEGSTIRLYFDDK